MRSSFFKVGLALGVVSAFAVGIPACGSSSDSGGSGGKAGTAGTGGSSGSGGSSGTAGTAGGAGTDAGTGGTGGTAGASGTAGTSGSGGSAGSASVTCGTATCAPVDITLLSTSLPACCPTGTTDKCGLDLSLLSAVGITPPDPCVEKNQPGNADTSCPPITFQSVVTLDGCCTPSGNCGYLANDLVGGQVQLGLGCVDPSSLGFTPEGGLTTCTPGGTDGGAGASGDAAAD